MSKDYHNPSSIDQRYVEAWRSYRRLRRTVVFSFLLAMIELRFLFVVPALIYALTFFIYFLLALWLANWKCPRCRESYFHGAFLKSLLGGRCFHCSLEKWSVTEYGSTLIYPKFPIGWKKPLTSDKQADKQSGPSN